MIELVGWSPSLYGDIFTGIGTGGSGGASFKSDNDLVASIICKTPKLIGMASRGFKILIRSIGHSLLVLNRDSRHGPQSE
jgi:hypothetical protein